MYRHYLTYILENKEPKNIHLVFGNAVHDSIDAAKKGEKYPWITMGKTIYKWAKENPTYSYKDKEGKKVVVNLDPKEWTKQAFNIYNEIFDWLDEKFPNYELIGSEIALYEPIPGVEDLKFKGFIDFFIKVDGKYHLIDFKTCGWGWGSWKRTNTHKNYQLILYKDFLCRKMELDPKSVTTHFVLLKREPPEKASRIELVTITSGAKKMSNADAWMKKQAKSMKRGLKLKNRTACKFCSFRRSRTEFY